MQITFHSALIMGSSRRIGRAIAIELAQEGAKKIGIPDRAGWSARAGHVRGIVTVDDIIDAIIEETTEDVQKSALIVACNHRRDHTLADLFMLHGIPG